VLLLLLLLQQLLVVPLLPVVRVLHVGSLQHLLVDIEALLGGRLATLLFVLQ
jgi:hypothetical protein